MGAIIILPEYGPPPPSALLGVVYADTFGGLSITYLDTVGSTWDGSPAVLWTTQAASPWSSQLLNTTRRGQFSSQYSDLTYVPSTDELYYPGVDANDVVRVSRSSGSLVASITAVSAPTWVVQSLAYDKNNDEFHATLFNGTDVTPPLIGGGGRISSFISRANFDTGTFPTTGPTVYATSGLNGQEQWAMEWDEVGSGAVNGPHPGTMYLLSAQAGGYSYCTDWAGTGTFVGASTGGGGRKSIAIDNNVASQVLYVCRTASQLITRFAINGGSATGSVSFAGILPNYDSSGNVWIFEYT